MKWSNAPCPKCNNNSWRKLLFINAAGAKEPDLATSETCTLNGVEPHIHAMCGVCEWVGPFETADKITL